jgi:nucleoid-associated protein YgaU
MPIAIYTVQSGDSLYAIAAKFLGDGNRWPHIYNINKNVIGSNPHLIRPGQVLKIIL